MNVKKVYTADVRYGVVIAKYSNVILVGDPPVINAETIEALDNLVQDKPLQEGRPLHEVIPSVEYFRQYIEDNNLTIDPGQSLEALRQCAEQLFNTAEWSVGIVVAPGQKYRHNNILYEVIQGHTTQPDWEPQATPALWKVATPISLIAEWKQPTGAHDAYKKGDKVLFNGSTYESLIDANVWSPSVYPAGWRKL